ALCEPAASGNPPTTRRSTRPDGLGPSVPATRIHRCKVAPIQVDHARREAAMLGDPCANLLRVATHQELGPFSIRDFMSIGVWFPRCMESEACPLRDAEVIARDEAEHHGAGR